MAGQLGLLTFRLGRNSRHLKVNLHSRSVSSVHPKFLPQRFSGHTCVAQLECDLDHTNDSDSTDQMAHESTVIVEREKPRKNIVASFSTQFPKVTFTRSGDLATHSKIDESDSKIPNPIKHNFSKKFFHTNFESMELVDDLMSRTSKIVDPLAANVVAFSGGVDSSVVAALVSSSFNGHVSNNCFATNGSAKAVLGISPAVPHSQVVMARKVANIIGIPLTEVRTSEGSDEDYIRNDGHACYVCKTHLYSTLETVANSIMKEEEKLYQEGKAFDASSVQRRPTILYNGTNADDTQDPTRLGLRAASNFQVSSPLDQITKDQVRQAAKYLGLPNWNAAASPCLRSRLAFGVSATQKHLAAVEKAEEHVRSALGLDETQNVRVRMLAGERAMVELDESVLLKPNGEYVQGVNDEDNWVVRILKSDGFVEKCIEEWGFKSFGGVRKFKTGAVAALPRDGFL